MFRALKVFFAFICLVMTIQAVVTASADVDHANDVSVTVPVVKLPLTVTSLAASQNGPVVIANQPSAASANLRKKEENEVELEDVTPFAVPGPYQVQLLYYYPDLNSIYTNDGVATIGPSVEFPAAHYGYFSVNLKLRKMIITFLVSPSWSPGTFNGPVITSLTSGANLPQPAYFISYSTYQGPGILTSTATTIALNWQGLSFNPGDVIVIGW